MTKQSLTHNRKENITMSKTSLDRMALVSLVLMGLVPLAAGAQVTPAPQRSWEFMVSSGSMVPTGVQKETLQRGGLTAAQLARVIRPSVALSATVGWARSRDVAQVGDPQLDVFLYDVGAEFRRLCRSAGGARSLMPFAGVGVGGRSYNYRKLDVDAVHNLTAYGSVGGEVGLGRVSVRLEARNYVSGFKPLQGTGSTVTRNDVMFLGGLRLGMR